MILPTEKKVPSGRVVYAFSPMNRHHFRAAEGAGNRPVLLSAYYFSGKEERDIPMMEQWREYSKPYYLLVDSGIYTFKSKLGYTATSFKFTDMDEEERKAFQSRGEQELGETLDKFVSNYLNFLQYADGYWDYAIDLDVDEFLGVDKADEFYAEMCKIIPRSKIMRVWHSTRTLETWEEWCADPEIEYLALEGANLYNRDIQVYQDFIKPAEKNGKKTHILATTIERFQKHVDSTTVDSSTFLQGGRNATVLIPGMGFVSFGEKTDVPVHYVHLNKAEKRDIQEWLDFIDISLKECREDWVVRCSANLLYFDYYVDVPYAPGAANRRLF